MSLLKIIVEIFFCNFKWARKFVGGVWARNNNGTAEWVYWSSVENKLPFTNGDLATWLYYQGLEVEDYRKNKEDKWKT